MPQLTLPISFFKKERNQVYSGWRLAFWRELIANSIDAGATKIEIEISPESIRFADNGKGMSREVCENVYLRLGASTKEANSDGVGGFGRARILTCFSMEEYEIRSANYFLKGRGAEYELVEAEPVEGFELIVRDEFDADAARSRPFRDALCSVLTGCDLPHVEFWLNGEPLVVQGLVRTEKSPRKFFAGEVFLQEHPSLYGYMTFRVNGLEMFRSWSGQLDHNVMVVELDPATAREHLTASRDSIRPRLANAVASFVQDYIRAGDAEMREVNRNDEVFMEGQQGWLISSGGVSAWSDRGYLLDRTKAPEEVEGMLGRRSFTNRGRNGENPHHHIFFSVRTDNPVLSDAADKWNPEVWVSASGAEGKWQLLTAWRAAVEFAIRTFHETYPTSGSIVWAVGLTFREAIATHFSVAANSFTGHVFSLNPVLLVEDGPDKWRATDRINPTNKACQRELLAVALHEVAHILSDTHDANFSTALTLMMAKFDQAEGFRAIKTALAETIAWHYSRQNRA